MIVAGDQRGRCSAVIGLAGASRETGRKGKRAVCEIQVDRRHDWIDCSWLVVHRRRRTRHNVAVCRDDADALPRSRPDVGVQITYIHRSPNRRPSEYAQKVRGNRGVAADIHLYRAAVDERSCDVQLPCRVRSSGANHTACSVGQCAADHTDVACARDRATIGESGCNSQICRRAESDRAQLCESFGHAQREVAALYMYGSTGVIRETSYQVACVR